MAEIQVLHVDDEPDMRLLVKASLDLAAGISTRSAASGTEALDATTTWRPDVILLDAVMPGMDGLATLKALQTNPKTAGIPVLFLTGRCAASDIDSFKANGSAGVIAKPFDPRTLAAAIRGYVQATAVTSALAGSAPLPGSPPDFAGRSSGPAGMTAADSGVAAPRVGASTVGATTEALLLDGNGNAFAVTITDHAAARSGSGTSPATGPRTREPSLEAASAQAAPIVAVHVAPLDQATVSDLLGPDLIGLLNGDDHPVPATDGSAIDGAVFPIGHAVGCTPWGGAMDPSVGGRQAAGLDALHHLGSISPSSDWAAVLPRASMH